MYIVRDQASDSFNGGLRRENDGEGRKNQNAECKAVFFCGLCLIGLK